MADCVTDYEKILWLFGELPARERARIAAHLESCQRCAEDVASLRRAAELLEARESNLVIEEGNACLDEADLAAWADGRLDPETRAGTLSHLVGCSRCRRAVASLVETLRSERVASAVRELEEGGVGKPGPGPRRAYRVGAVVAAVAAVLAGVLFLGPTDLEIEETPPYREGPPGPTSVPQAIAPLGELEAVEVFTWSPVGGADRYRLSVFDDEGTVVWEAETEEARLAPPETLEFEAGAQFFWKVAARVGWDHWVGSELVTFTISQP